MSVVYEYFRNQSSLQLYNINRYCILVQDCSVQHVFLFELLFSMKKNSRFGLTEVEKANLCCVLNPHCESL